MEKVKHTVRRDLNLSELSKDRYLIGIVYRAPDESLEDFHYLDNVIRRSTRNSLEDIVIGDQADREAALIYHG